MAHIRFTGGVLALTVVAAAMIAPRPAGAIELWFDVTAERRFEQSLGSGGSIDTVEDTTFQPVQFILRMDVDPVFHFTEDTGDTGDWRLIVTRFTGASYVSPTPFNAEMEACNTLGVTGVGLSPWYHYSQAYEAWDFSAAPSGTVGAQVQHALSNTTTPDNRMYVHVLCMSASNPTLTVPPTSIADMAPWTREQFLTFITHGDTVWQFREQAFSQDGVVQNDVLVPDYYHGLMYTGPAEVIPEPGTLALLLAAAVLALGRRHL